MDESRGDAFTQIVANVPANPEKEQALRELKKLNNRERSESDRELAKDALVAIARNVRLDSLADRAEASAVPGTREV